MPPHQAAASGSRSPWRHRGRRCARGAPREGGRFGWSCCAFDLSGNGTEPEDVANCVREVGAIEGIEVNLVHALSREAAHLVCSQGEGNELTDARLIVEAVEGIPDELRH